MFEYFATGAAEIAARYLDPKSFKTVTDETFFGRIDGGPSGEAVSFFATDRGLHAPRLDNTLLIL
ncbi:MAG TPA: hypothetical protein VHP61_06325 [Acidobacteriota bacterium]|nr:hypothetical protein [Acidobacteriota bacterium]